MENDVQSEGDELGPERELSGDEQQQHPQEEPVASEAADDAAEGQSPGGGEQTPERGEEEEEARSVETTAMEALEESGDSLAFSLEEKQALEFAERSKELQLQVAPKEEEMSRVYEARLAGRDAEWAARVDEAVEASRREQAAGFSAEIRQLKIQHSEEVTNALKACRLAQEELEAQKVKHAEEVQRIRTEKEEAHSAEVQGLRAEIGKLQVEVERLTRETAESSGSEKWASLLPQSPSSQLSPQMHKELRLQKERLQRQHECELKFQEQKLRNELSLESDRQRAKLEEEYTEQLAQAHTESALKNVTQVEQISQQLLSEKQKAVSVLEEELAGRHEQEVARLLEERREVVEACRVELESTRSEYQSKIAELEAALTSEREKRVISLTEQYQDDWLEREERLRGEMEAEFGQRMEAALEESGWEKEAAVASLRQAMEERLQNELRAAHETHQQTLRENLAQLRETHEQEIAAVRESVQQTQAALPEHQPEDGQHVEALKTQLVKEHMTKFQQMTEKLQAVHQAELVAMQRKREVEEGEHQEEVERVREEVEERLHHEMEQLTQSHKTEVELLQQTYQSRLDEMTTSQQHALTQVRGSVEGRVDEVRQQSEARLREMEQQHQSQLEQLHSKHSANITVVEEEGAKRLVEVGRELEQVREHSQALQTQLDSLKSELSGLHEVVEKQRAELSRQEEEREQLNRGLREAGAREREREEQAAREHREDTASLTMLQTQLSNVTAEKSALQSSLAMLQSSVAGCVQLASLVEQTLSPPSTSSHTHHWHSPTAQHEDGEDQLEPHPLSDGEGSAGSHSQEDTEGEEEENTLTPPVTTSPGSAVVGVASGSSMAWTRSGASLRSATMLRYTPSDDSGLASQQVSVVNSEATMLTTPLMDGVETTPTTSVASHPSPPPHSHQPPNLTILPLDATTLSPDRSQAPPAGLSYDQSQFGMLSISFLDATQHPSHPPPSHPPYPPAPPSTQSGELSIMSLDQSLLPLSLSDLPALQGGLSHLHEAVSALLQRYISLSAEAADYQQRWITSTTQLREMVSSQGVLESRVSELETAARVREERMTHTAQQLTAAHGNMQGVVREVEEARAEAERLRQELSSSQEALAASREELAASQQREEETQAQLRGKSEDADSQQRVFESQESESQQRLQVLEAQTAQLQEELQAAQRNCASAVHEREALREENGKLAAMRVTLEGQLHSLGEESSTREAEGKRALREKEDEIRELQAVRVELASCREAEEGLQVERDELQRRLSGVEHQLALCQAVSVEEQLSRIRELTASETQLSGELREEKATCRALGERVRVAQDSLNQTTQENLSLKLAQTQLEGEVRRLRAELQRRETALHRAEAQSASLGRELTVATEELGQLRGRMEGEGVGVGEEGGESGESEGEEGGLAEEGSAQELVSSLQRELQQQCEVEGSLHSQLGLLRDTLSSKDRELEALRMARAHQESALQEMRTRLTSREEEGEEQGEEQGEGEDCAVLVGGGEAESILAKLAELAPILSREAHAVNQLTKNLTLLDTEQLQAAIDQLGRVVAGLSEQSGEAGSGGVLLGAVQTLVQQLSALLSSLDQGNNPQLTQQLSTVGEVLSQLQSVDREALVQDANALRETAATLQEQLHHQSAAALAQAEQSGRELAQLRSKLEDTETGLLHSNETNAQLRVSLESEVSQTSRLRGEQQATQDAVGQLEAEVEGLQTLLTSVTSELEEARSHLAEYQQTEDSLERSAHTISSLHQELRSCKAREAELESVVQEASFSQSELEQQHITTLTSIQEELQLERAAKDEVCLQLTEVQSQLQLAEEAWRAGEAEGRRLRENLEDREVEGRRLRENLEDREVEGRRLRENLEDREVEGRQLRESLEEREAELGVAREAARRVEEVCREREGELGRLQAHLSSLETDNREQGEHYSQLLDNERRMVASLRSSLQAKERELTGAMDRFLQEKVGGAKAQGELAAIRARLQTAHQNISSLQSKVSSLRAEGETKVGDDTLRQLELDQLRRQLHQMQTNTEQQSGALSELRREKMELQSSVSRLRTQVTTLQEHASHDREELCGLRGELGGREEEVGRLHLQLDTLQTAASLTTLPDLLQDKLVRLYAKYREAEVHRKALVFQKNYLKCQCDAFFQTQQTALVLMADMGVPVTTLKSKPPVHHLLKFKMAVHVVMATLRFQYVVRRKHQYIQSYANRIEREKNSDAHARVSFSDTAAHSSTAVLSSGPREHRPTTTPAASSRYTLLPPSNAAPPQPRLPSTRHGRTSAAPQPRLPSTRHGRTSAAPQPRLPSTRHMHTSAASQPTSRGEPQLSAYIPSLARLQTKLSGTVS